MGKCADQFEEITNDMKCRIECGEINGDGVQTLYLGLIAGYLATIVDELRERNDGGKNGNNTGND